MTATTETRGPALAEALRWPRQCAAAVRLDRGGMRERYQVIPDPALCGAFPIARPGEIVAWLPIMRQGRLSFVLGCGRYADIRAQARGLRVHWVGWADESGDMWGMR